jgi:hypothetical protein
MSSFFKKKHLTTDWRLINLSVPTIVQIKNHSLQFLNSKSIAQITQSNSMNPHQAYVPFYGM